MEELIGRAADNILSVTILLAWVYKVEREKRCIYDRMMKLVDTLSSPPEK